ncbi:hypothetical protein LguiA_025989 [Lonicera macranthoides]
MYWMGGHRVFDLIMEGGNSDDLFNPDLPPPPPPFHLFYHSLFPGPFLILLFIFHFLLSLFLLFIFIFLHSAKIVLAPSV